MEVLKQRILSEGKAVGKDMLLVDSFLNQQVDVQLMMQIGEEFARIFAGKGVTRVATIESSGIAPAAMTAFRMNVPLVIMKKVASNLLSELFLQVPVRSFAKASNYMLTVKRSFIKPGDRVLIIDDFLANGEAAAGAAKLVENAGAEIAGIGCVIEKAFQPGRSKLEAAGYDVKPLVSIKRLEEGIVEFAAD